MKPIPLEDMYEGPNPAPFFALKILLRRNAIEVQYEYTPLQVVTNVTRFNPLASYRYYRLIKKLLRKQLEHVIHVLSRSDEVMG